MSSEILAHLGAKINEGFAAIKTSFENFSALRDAASQAVHLRDEARVGAIKCLDDLTAAIAEVRASLDQDTKPTDPPAPPAG